LHIQQQQQQLAGKLRLCMRVEILQGCCCMEEGKGKKPGANFVAAAFSSAAATHLSEFASSHFVY
jgi:hypothetical protein